MKRILISATLLLAGVPLQTQASAGTARPTTPSRAVVLKLSDLRSAYLIRAGIVYYDASATSPAELRAQLQRHFDVVISLLIAATPTSIETALARLEGASAHAWTEAERDACRKKLLATRYVQLRRLATYRDYGLFPQNEGQSSAPAPIFVDDHDTACAVGMLMRWSGWEKQVATIRSESNLVYVPDVSSGAIASWTATSGLTIEEAALVQPGYASPTPTTTLGNLLPQDAFVDYGGLRFSHFSLKRENGQYTAPSIEPTNGTESFCNSNPGFCQPNFTNPVEVFTPSANAIGLTLSSGTFVSPGLNTIKILPYGTQWMFVGSYGSSSSGGLGMRGTATTTQRVVFGFQVDTLSSTDRLDKLVLGMSSYMGGFFNGRIDTDVYGSAVYVPGVGTFPVGKLGSANLNHADNVSENGYFTLDEVKIDGRQSVYVEARLYAIYQSSSLDSFVLHFDVVPEPLSGSLLVIGLGIVLIQRRR